MFFFACQQVETILGPLRLNRLFVIISDDAAYSFGVGPPRSFRDQYGLFLECVLNIFEWKYPFDNTLEWVTSTTDV